MEHKFKYLPTPGSGVASEPEESVPVRGDTPCPCCGNITIPNGGDATAYICPVCLWEIDPFAASEEEQSDQNHGLTLMQARENYRKYGAVLERLKQYCREPLPEELPENNRVVLNRLLRERDLLPILFHNDGTTVTSESWHKRRGELLEALEKYSYGHTPPAPAKVWGEVVESDPIAYAGKVEERAVTISFETEHGCFSFPIKLFIPKAVEKPPVFLHLAFRRTLPDRYVPVEEITDAGYALAVVCYEDMVNDNHFGDYSDGLAAYFGTTIDREPEEWGKIGMWAYGASRVLDYLYQCPEVDAEHTAVIGHSRLGKTALWAGAQDERFWCVISNNSGYGGAATSKHGNGERVADFIRVGSWDWYCENFKQYTGEKEDEKPYDQAWLLALIAPRYLCVGSAVEDRGADPESEFLTSLWASQAWELLGEDGLVTPDSKPEVGDALQDGCIGYHLRAGRHFLSREDWNTYIRFLDRKLGRR